MITAEAPWDTIENLLKSKHSDFYRNHLKANSLPEFKKNMGNAWGNVPFLTRPEIEAVPLMGRLFSDFSDVHFIRNSSGTMTGKPAYLPRNIFGPYNRYVDMAGARRSLMLSPNWWMAERARRLGGLVHASAPQPHSEDERAYAAKIGKLLGINCVVGIPHVIAGMAPAFEKEGILEDIEVVEFMADRCSPGIRAQILRDYNSPTLFTNYAASEWRGMFGGPCEYTLEHRLTSFHLEPEHFYAEFVDPETGKEADLSTPAELVLTSLTDEQPFPLVRYRTGDLLGLEDEACPCGRGRRFASFGRAKADYVKFRPGVITLPDLEQVVFEHEDSITFDFEAEIDEVPMNESLAQIVRLLVTPVEGKKIPEGLADSIANKLTIGPMTYKEAEREKLCGPLHVDILRKRSFSAGGKQRRLRIVT